MNTTTQIRKGGLIEFCQILQFEPSILFSPLRRSDVRLKRGMLLILLKRDGYSKPEAARIAGLTYSSYTTTIQYAMREIYSRRNPIATEQWNKVKDLSFVKSPDVRKAFMKELEEVGVFFEYDKENLLISKRVAEAFIPVVPKHLKRGT